MSIDRYVTLAEVKRIMEAEDERRELTSEQKMVMEHAHKFSKLPVEDTIALREELLEVEFIDEAMATKITDLLPEHPDDVRVLFSKERMVLKKEHIKTIMDIVSKYA